MNKLLSIVSFSAILLITSFSMASPDDPCDTSEKGCYGTTVFKNHQSYRACLIIFYYSTNGQQNLCLNPSGIYQIEAHYGDQYCWIGKPEKPEPCVKQPINLL